MKIVDKTLNLLLTSGIVGIIAGVIAFLFSVILGAIPQDGLFQILLNVVLLTIFIAFGFGSKVFTRLFDFIAFFFAVGIVGSAIALFVPAISGYIIDMNELTITGLLMTGVYVSLAILVKKKWLDRFIKV